MPYWDTLLATALNLIERNEFSVAVVVAHMACEVRVATAISSAFQAKGLTYLEEAILEFFQRYNLANERIRNIYSAITGNEIQKQPFWHAFKESAKRRNEVIHAGLILRYSEAEASMKAVSELLAYLN
jgi:hypothetical protein